MSAIQRCSKLFSNNLWRAIINLENRSSISDYKTFAGSRPKKVKNRFDPPDWFVPKKTYNYFENLTPSNKDFLKEVAFDRYITNAESPLAKEPAKRNTWNPCTKRSGVLGVKIGVLPQWTKDGTKLFTTLVQIIDNHVVRYVPPEDYKNSSAATLYMKNRNYGSVVVGALSCYPTGFTKSYVNLFQEAGVPPKRKLTRFLVTPDAAIEPGTPLTASHFNVGDYVDVQARTIGHGFQGVVKRWGFKGGPKSHGATKWHRRPGTIASGGRTGLIYKGKKMPGKMGNRWRHHRGLKIWRINYRYNVLYLTGPSTPGSTHSYIRIFDTILPSLKKEMTAKEIHPPMPTAYPEDFNEGLPEEVFDDELFQLHDPTLKFETD